jgi:hypothetical protein
LIGWHPAESTVVAPFVVPSVFGIALLPPQPTSAAASTATATSLTP